MPKRYWLMKSDPENFSWVDLKNTPKQTTFWNGVRNYQARNFLRDDVKKGDGVLFYHSRQESPAVMGTADVVKEGYADSTQFDPKSKYYDAGSDSQNPRWFMVDIRLDREFKRPVSIEEIRKEPTLKGMVLLQKGSRLSVQPVTKSEFETIIKMGT